jgi:hypothetical protein
MNFPLLIGHVINGPIYNISFLGYIPYGKSS